MKDRRSCQERRPRLLGLITSGKITRTDDNTIILSREKRKDNSYHEVKPSNERLRKFLECHRTTRNSQEQKRVDSSRRTADITKEQEERLRNKNNEVVLKLGANRDCDRKLYKRKKKTEEITKRGQLEAENCRKR